MMVFGQAMKDRSLMCYINIIVAKKALYEMIAQETREVTVIGGDIHHESREASKSAKRCRYAKKTIDELNERESSLLATITSKSLDILSKADDFDELLMLSGVDADCFDPYQIIKYGYSYETNYRLWYKYNHAAKYNPNPNPKQTFELLKKMYTPKFTFNFNNIYVKLFDNAIQWCIQLFI